MIVVGAEIGLLVFAIITLVRGKLVLTKNRVVTGVPARVLALIGFLPLPLSLLLVLVLGIVFAARGQPLDRGPFLGISIAIEVGVLICCIAAVYGIGLAIAKPPEPERRPRRRRLEESSEEEEDDDAPRRRPAAAATDIQKGEPPLPTHVTAAPVPRTAPGRRPIAEPESGRAARPAGSRRTWIIALVAAGAVSVCCLGVAVVGGGLAWWRWRQPAAVQAVVVPGPNQIVQQPPPKVEPPRPQLKLPPIPVRPPIPPSQVKAKTTVSLPGRASRIVAGGGGRYLLLYFPELDQVGRFDAVSGKLAVDVRVPKDAVLAAGLSKLVTWSPATSTLTRWNLATGQQERTAPLPLGGKVTAFCMGSASDGPLLVSTEREFRLLDVDGATLTLPNDEQGQPLARLNDGSYWAAGTGRVFGRANRVGMPNGIATLALETDRAVQRYQHAGTFYNVPSPDGRYLYAGGHGVLTADLKVVPGAAYSNLQNDNARYLYLPAHHGPYYFHLHAGTDPGPGQGGERGIRIYRLGSPQPLKIVPDAGTPTFAEMRAVPDLRLEETAHLIPEAKLLVVIPKEGDRLLLQPVEL